MEYLILFIVTATISFFVGFVQGIKVGVWRILHTLNVPPGYRITGVHYEKIN